MKFVRLAQIFRPIEAANRTHSQSYVEDLLTKSGQKRCVKMARLNLSVLPSAHTEFPRAVDSRFAQASNDFCRLPRPDVNLNIHLRQ